MPPRASVPDPKTWRWMKPRVPTCTRSVPRDIRAVSLKRSFRPKEHERRKVFCDKKDSTSAAFDRNALLSSELFYEVRRAVKEISWILIFGRGRNDRPGSFSFGESDVLLSRQLARYVRNVFANGEQMRAGEREIEPPGCPPLFQGSWICTRQSSGTNHLSSSRVGPSRFCICWWHAPRKGLRGPSVIHHSEKRVTTPIRSTVP